MVVKLGAPNVSELQHLRRNDRAMIKGICDTKLTDNLSTDLLLKKHSIYSFEECLSLQWYGHVKRASCCINQISDLRGQGIPRKTC